jgi:hypothetical protein
MKPTCNEYKVPSALDMAIDQLYAIFRVYQAPKNMLDVCVGCCMPEPLEKEMRTLRLVQLNAKHFREYNESAKSRVQPAREIKYFLPRMLQLLAQGAELHHSTELYLQRMGNCDPSEYSATERLAIDRFALAYFAEGLSQYPTGSAHRFAGSSAFDILLMFHLGGVTLEPLLAYWLQTQEPASTLHYAESSYWGFWSTQNVKNAFAQERSGFCETMQSWMLNTQHRERFAQKLLAVDVDKFETAETCSCCSRPGLACMVGSVFDWVSC